MMDTKPLIFLSKLPVLTDYVIIVGEITTTGPHLLNSACCRALLRRTSNILCSPAINDKKHVYIVVHKNDVKNKSFSENVAACNLKLVKVMQLTNTILQFCLDFTLHTNLHPHWTRVDNKYLEGKTCLFQNHWMGCVRAQINIQDGSVIIALKASQVKLIVARLSTFHIREDIIQKFMKKEIRTINSHEMGDNTCYVLPSFKPALVHSISYDIDYRCPLKDKSDMIAYWLDYHGMLIPSDTDIFVTLSFNFPGAPIMTYPYYCVRKNFVVTKHCADIESIDSFMSQVNIVMKEKLPSMEMKFPIQPSLSTVPSVSNNCLVTKSHEIVRCSANKTDAQKLSNMEKSQADKQMIMPLHDSRQQKSVNNNTSSDHTNSNGKIKPRFTPYQKTSAPPNSVLATTVTTICNKAADKANKIIPSFKPLGSSDSYLTMSKNDVHNDNYTHTNVSNGKQCIKNIPSGDQSAHLNNRPRNNSLKSISNCLTPNLMNNKNSKKSPSPFPGKKLSQTRVAMTPKGSWSGNKFSQSKVQTSNQTRTPKSVSSSFDQDQFDDFEIPLSLNYPGKSPNIRTGSNKTPLTTPKQSPVLISNTSPSPTIKTPLHQKKARAPPKILDDEQVLDLFRLGQIAKVNNHSLSAFLKKRGVKGVTKMKKDDLINGVVQLLSGQTAHEP